MTDIIFDIEEAYRLRYAPRPSEGKPTFASIGKKYSVSRQYVQKVLSKIREDRLEALAFEAQIPTKTSLQWKRCQEILDNKLKNGDALSFADVKGAMELISKSKMSYEKHVENSSKNKSKNMDDAAEAYLQTQKELVKDVELD